MPNTLHGKHIRVIWLRIILPFTAIRFAGPRYERASFQYNSVVDFTLPWIYDHFAFLIPVPDESANINAVVKPFQWPVWLGLGISIVCVIAILNLTQRYLQYRSTFETSFRPSYNLTTAKEETREQYLYVFGNLLSQGGSCKSKRLPYRLVAGVWTLAAFVFVQAYTSTLFTYVVTPINHPLIDSVYDTNNYMGLFRNLRKKIDSFPNSRCATASDCIRPIKPESKIVLLEANIYLKDAIRKNLKKTGKCNLQIAKEEFIAIMSTLVLQKNSPYTQSIQQG
ncbi:hypothetical protein DAPPUDRAFT_241316 [Daphnia pulex]|uniref:Ionotropic glutamate receptor C-terminal domain-containing protein n=1 Tax=Daphnia pulex TaxID=6669 RepID=E9GDY6_DAPPU|nr:hypothetical protein DAPPUDRAFT_241316 [Daphnia pulex]|eukprot:EFX82168.1 hypothetical protein DAPPUDRAFT_241316 [Daphnia pulex]